MLPISPIAQKALEAIQAAIPPGKTYFERGQAVINLTKLIPSGSALARVLLRDKVWPSTSRDQHFSAWSGNPQYANFRHIGSGGFQMDYFLTWIDKAVAAEGTAEIEERHIAKALAGEDGTNLRDMGIDGRALVEEVTQMEAARPAPKVSKSESRAAAGRNAVDLSSDSLKLLVAAYHSRGEAFRLDFAQGSVVQTGEDKPFVLDETARARYALEELERAGFLRRESDQHYVVTVDGRDFVETQTAENIAARAAAAHEIDAVAGIGNRTYLESASRDIFEKCRAEGIPCATLFLDTDDFKTFNQQYGHSAGDKVLRAVAQTMNRAIRLRGGVVGRWGAGDEIVATMSNLTVSEAAALGERIRAAMERTSVDGMKVTVSVGVASGIGLATIEDLWNRADKGLTEAKRLGKNRVTVQE